METLILEKSSEIPVQEVIFSKVTDLQPVTLLKNELIHRCFLIILLTFNEHLF